MKEEKIVLPPGLQFDPTDEELIVSFLNRRAANLPCYPNIIPDLDIYTAHLMDLHEKAFWSEKECFFFSGLKHNQSTERRFWKEIGLSEPIYTSNGDNINEIGIKNYLVFCGEDGAQSNWVMEEYHLLNTASFTTSQEWVVCKVREGNLFDCEECNIEKNGDEGVELSYLDEVFFAMDDDNDITFPT